MFRRIIYYFRKRAARKKFLKRCLMLPCTHCPNFIDNGRDGKCKLAIELGLEEL